MRTGMPWNPYDRKSFLPKLRVLQNSESVTVGTLAQAVNKFEASDIPLLASPRRGVAARVRKCREASIDSADGVVFRLRTQRKTTPAASASVASRNLLGDAATPPCGDARRGISLACNSFRSLTKSNSGFCKTSK